MQPLKSVPVNQHPLYRKTQFTNNSNPKPKTNPKHNLAKPDTKLQSWTKHTSHTSSTMIWRRVRWAQFPCMHLKYTTRITVFFRVSISRNKWHLLIRNGSHLLRNTFAKPKWCNNSSLKLPVWHYQHAQNDAQEVWSISCLILIINACIAKYAFWHTNLMFVLTVKLNYPYLAII